MKTALKVVSILQIICGVLVAFIGLAATGLFAASEVPGSSFFVVLGLLPVISGAVGIVCGALGMRAANHPEKATPAVVVGVISVVFAALSLVLQFSMQNLAGCVIPVIYLVCALGMKNQSSTGAN